MTAKSETPAEGREHLEIELKFEAGGDLRLPQEWPCGLTASRGFDDELNAVYFDTPDQKLARAGMALRRRSGGPDAGWHLKQRVSDEVQREQLWPYEDSLPEACAQTLDARVPGVIEHLQIVAEIVTRRSATVLSDDTGTPVVEISDDRVVAAERSRSLLRAWREWEVEVLDEHRGSSAEREELLTALRDALCAVGAQPSLAGSKIARAVGALLPAAIEKQGSDALVAALSIQDSADRIAARAVTHQRGGSLRDSVALSEAQADHRENQARADRLRRLARQVLDRGEEQA